MLPLSLSCMVMGLPDSFYLFCVPCEAKYKSVYVMRILNCGGSHK